MKAHPLKSSYHPHDKATSPLLLHFRPRSENQKIYLEAMRQYPLILANGPAGTGKTFLAVACATQALLSGAVARIILSRPVLEAGERLGFLPGDMREKTDPYLRPLYDALGDLIGPETAERYIHAGLIEIAPLAFMRGRSLNKAFVILDEAQNCTRAQMKMFLTRLGTETTLVACGDCQQSDLPKTQTSGFQQALTLFQDIDDVKIVQLQQQDIQRHMLLEKIIQAYQGEENKNKKDREKNE